MGRAAETRLQRPVLLQVIGEVGFQPAFREQAILDHAFQAERVGRRADRQRAVSQLKQPRQRQFVRARGGVLH